jgi:DNA invertase Pin-like site-specific DNA recombinase
MICAVTDAPQLATEKGSTIFQLVGLRVTEVVEAKITALRSTGMGVCKIARTAGFGVSTVPRVIAATGAAA